MSQHNTGVWRKAISRAAENYHLQKSNSCQAAGRDSVWSLTIPNEHNLLPVRFKRPCEQDGLGLVEQFSQNDCKWSRGGHEVVWASGLASHIYQSLQ